MIDKISLKRAELVHPRLRFELKKILEECDEALTGRAMVRLSQGIRTNKEQDELYAQGRTIPGKKVTNVKGGDSYHNYGLAVDIVLIIDGKVASWDTKADWDQDGQADWMEVVLIFKKHGWTWGGDWRTFKDMPHFQKTFGNNIASLKSKKKDKDGYVLF